MIKGFQAGAAFFKTIQALFAVVNSGRFRGFLPAVLGGLILMAVPAFGELSITAVGECLRAPEPAGLSGLTYVGGSSFYAVDDSGAKMFPMTIQIDSDTGAITSNTNGTEIKLTGTDLEGIAYDPLKKTVLVSDETGATIQTYSLSGRFLGSVDVPKNLRKYRNNFSLESLSIRADGLELWTSNEEALPDDGPLSSVKSGTVVRLTRFQRVSAQSPWMVSGQWAYRTEPVRGQPYQGRECSGVSDLCVLPDGTLLVLERAMGAQSRGLPGYQIQTPMLYARIYQVGFRGATEVKDLPSLAGTRYTPVAKTLLFEKNTVFSNYEGICLGPRLRDGSRSLILISDGDDLASEALYALKLQGLGADF